MNSLHKYVLAGMLCLAATFGVGKDIYVATNGHSVSPYANWLDAATNIQWAVNVGINDDTVWISNGVYVLTNQITVRSNLTLCGTDTNNKPVVDGKNATRCFYFANTVTGSLANLFIANGYANDGGGVYMVNGHVRDCVFSNNNATGYGGGLSAWHGSGAVERCVFIQNSASSYGGGLSVYSNCFFRVDQCVFMTNSTLGNYGGGLACLYVAGLTVTNCDIVGNFAKSGGGGIYGGLVRAVPGPNLITHCRIANNAVSNGGGGIYLGGGGDAYTVAHCAITNNSATNLGGGVLLSCSAVLRDCLIARNRQTPAIDLATRGGGGLTVGGGGQAINCTIEGNTAACAGGGVYLSSDNSLVRNCLIRDNSCAGPSYGGGGIRFRYATTGTVENCTIVSNYASVRGGGVYLIGGNERIDNCIIYSNRCATVIYDNYYIESTTALISNSCFYPEMGAAYTNYSANNITNNPIFVDWTSGNYRLNRASPGVNAGANRDWMAGALDLENHNRKDIFSGIVDMGCYEYLPSGNMFNFR